MTQPPFLLLATILTGGVDHHKYAGNYGFGPSSEDLYARVSKWKQYMQKPKES